jgi:adenylate cyclase
MGDGIMVIFGAPIQKPDDILRSVYTAFRLQVRFNEFFKEISPMIEQRPLGLGISITSGEAIVGNFGSSNRMEYTAIGDVVNLAARLEKLAEAGEIVVDQKTFSQLPQFRFKYTQFDDVKLKGLDKQSVFKLHEVIRTNTQ